VGYACGGGVGGGDEFDFALLEVSGGVDGLGEERLQGNEGYREEDSARHSDSLKDTRNCNGWGGEHTPEETRR
jgi:hypothetical protein